MAPKRVIPALMALVLVLPLAACSTAPGNSAGFRKNYVVARTALEGGEYAKANREYKGLMESAGPFLPRIQLEYAHSLLRAGDYAGAARIAEGMALSEPGAGGAAALAVAATARHELGKAALAQGDTAGGKAHLTRAATAMSEVLETYPQLDPLGGLAGRKASIEARLGTL